MKYSKIVPYCYGCGRVESEEGWKILEKSKKTAKHYETLCKECLVNITDRLIEEVQGNPRDKVA